MIPRRWWTDTIRVISPTIIIERGTEVFDWTNPTSTVFNGCHVQPLAGDEVFMTEGRRNAVVTRWKLFAPLSLGVTAHDRIEYEGQVYEMDGPPRKWPGFTLAHIEAILMMVEG